MQIINDINKKNLQIVAVDFDGTLCVKEKFPQIGAPNSALIKWLIGLRSMGTKIILWTCRIDEDLDAAIRWCGKFGLEFDAVNENITKFEKEIRKVYADLYIDDRAVPPFWEEVQ